MNENTPPLEKQPCENRTASIRAGLTIAEKAFVQEQVANSGLSEAEYTRRRLLGVEVPRASVLSTANAAMVSELNRLGNQVKALGNVTNQVATYLHNNRELRPDWEPVPAEIIALLREIESALERVIYDGSEVS